MRVKKDTVVDEEFYNGTERVHGILELLLASKYKILSVIYQKRYCDHVFIIFSEVGE